MHQGQPAHRPFALLHQLVLRETATRQRRHYKREAMQKNQQRERPKHPCLREELTGDTQKGVAPSRRPVRAEQVMEHEQHEEAVSSTEQAITPDKKRDDDEAEPVPLHNARGADAKGVKKADHHRLGPEDEHHLKHAPAEKENAEERHGIDHDDAANGEAKRALWNGLDKAGGLRPDAAL